MSRLYPHRVDGWSEQDLADLHHDERAAYEARHPLNAGREPSTEGAR